VAERYIFCSPTLENHRTNSVGFQTTLPVLDNPFSQRVNAVIQKTREMRRGVYHPHLYVVKEDGEPPLRLWALSGLIQDRADVLPSYQQFIGQLKDKVCLPGRAHQSCLTNYYLKGEWVWLLIGFEMRDREGIVGLLEHLFCM
jgi:hypothetical protein